MAVMSDNPISGDRVTRRVREPETSVAVASWENEGGHFPALRTAAVTPTDVSLRAPGWTMENGGLAAMRARFLADFADESMGRDHSTYRRRAHGERT